MEDYNLVYNIIKQCLITDLGCDKFESKPENGLIAFQYKQLQYVCVYTSDEPAYLRILLPGVDNIRDEITIQNYQHMLRLNAHYKVAKIELIENSFWFAVELFITGTSNLSGTIVRMVNLLHDMRNEYAQYINNTTQHAQ